MSKNSDAPLCESKNCPAAEQQGTHSPGTGTQDGNGNWTNCNSK